MYKTAIAIVTLMFLGISGISQAADSTAKKPLDQAIESIDKNLAKDPDNKGLLNAAERLQTNKERYEQKRAAQNAKRLEHSGDRAERAERPERIERPEKIERPERVARPEPMGRPGR